MTDDINEEPTLAAGRWAGAYAPTAVTTPPAPPAAGGDPDPESGGDPDPESGGDPDPASGEPPRSGRGRWIALAVVVALIAGAVGFLGTLVALDARDSDSNRVATSPNAGGSPGTTIPTTPTTPAQPREPKASALNGLIVQQSDLPADALVGKLPDWNDAVDTPTLDLCNGTYASESTRTARRQVETEDANRNPGVSTEAVLYRTPADATQAFAELRKVVAACPKRIVNSPVGEDPAMTVFHARPDATWPNVTGVVRQAYDFTTTSAIGASNRSIAVYLRRGRVLMGLYFPSTGAQQVTVQGKSAIPAITEIFAKRIAALPASVVN